MPEDFRLPPRGAPAFGGTTTTSTTSRPDPPGPAVAAAVKSPSPTPRPCTYDSALLSMLHRLGFRLQLVPLRCRLQFGSDTLRKLESLGRSRSSHEIDPKVASATLTVAVVAATAVAGMDRRAGHWFGQLVGADVAAAVRPEEEEEEEAGGALRLLLVAINFPPSLPRRCKDRLVSGSRTTTSSCRTKALPSWRRRAVVSSVDAY